MCQYSFFVESGGVRFAFDELDALVEFAKAQNQSIDSFHIKLGKHCSKLSDVDYSILSQLDSICIDDILEYLD